MQKYDEKAGASFFSLIKKLTLLLQEMCMHESARLARVKQPKNKGAIETLIWKSSGPMGQSSRLRVGLGQEEEGIDGRPHEGSRRMESFGFHLEKEQRW